jgi:hypothetical protein
MTSYALVESLPYPLDQRNFQNSVHPMAVQQIPIDKSYGYDALTHGDQHSNNSGYFSMQTGYGNDQLKVGYDKTCAQRRTHRDVLGVITYRTKYGDFPDPGDCGCTRYVRRNCTGQMKPKGCGGSPVIAGPGSSRGGECPKSEPVCCYPGMGCGPRQIGDKGTCIAGRMRKN